MQKQANAQANSWPDYFAQRARQCRDPQLQQFYAVGLPAPETPLRDVPFMALDFETTGMNAHRHAIVSIGMVPFTLASIRPAAGHYWVVRPAGTMSGRSVGIHHITHAEVATAPDLDEVLGEVLASLAGKIAVVHYRHIERPFLDAEVMARRGEPCQFPLVDTMAIEAYWTRQGLLTRLRRLFGLNHSPIRLAESRERYGLPHYTSHHAKVDALATAELFLAQVARYYSPDTPISELWL